MAKIYKKWLKIYKKWLKIYKKWLICLFHFLKTLCSQLMEYHFFTSQTIQDHKHKKTPFFQDFFTNFKNGQIYLSKNEKRKKLLSENFYFFS
jgi:hypothetical protein